MTPQSTPGIVLVTGAGRRLGQVIARDFASRGWRIAAHHHKSGGGAAELVADIRDAGGEAEAIQADLSEETAPTRLFEACADALGPATCLVNNAAQYEWDTLETMTPASWEEHMSINLRAPVFLSQAFAAQLPAGTAGNIVNILDQKVWRPNPAFFSYSVAKSALWSATQLMAQALAPHIRVNAVGPGPVFQSRHQTEDEFAAECGNTLLGQGILPEQICAAIRLLVETPSLTGQMIAVDSGQHLT
ncbi:Glucose 1-dehydrogenase 2 [Methyloligella halotolerans]|uniref:Glucose 1-dehydrogenase 2 n=1 Tax=Methyloligella halotolerans TaxID=1177755 RepID=A0A1E2RXU0_9HYPH|nr:SDR family oxidoreductase [Methyloligella halotolerans]ODA66925.1 Glucose 1-dehydrogenase 2 [Methyloligella halotolerans]